MAAHLASLFATILLLPSLYPLLLYSKAFLAWHFLHCFHSKLRRAIFISFSLSFPISMQFHRACLVLWYSVLCCCHASLWPSWRFLPCRDYWRRITEIPIIHTNVLQKERKFTEIFYGHLFTLVNSEQAMVLICCSQSKPPVLVIGL